MARGKRSTEGTTPGSDADGETSAQLGRQRSVSAMGPLAAGVGASVAMLLGGMPSAWAAPSIATCTPTNAYYFTNAGGSIQGIASGNATYNQICGTSGPLSTSVSTGNEHQLAVDERQLAVGVDLDGHQLAVDRYELAVGFDLDEHQLAVDGHGRAGRRGPKRGSCRQSAVQGRWHSHRLSWNQRDVETSYCGNRRRRAGVGLHNRYEHDLYGSKAGYRRAAAIRLSRDVLGRIRVAEIVYVEGFADLQRSAGHRCPGLGQSSAQAGRKQRTPIRFRMRRLTPSELAA